MPRTKKSDIIEIKEEVLENLTIKNDNLDLEKINIKEKKVTKKIKKDINLEENENVVKEEKKVTNKTKKDNIEKIDIKLQDNVNILKEDKKEIIIEDKKIKFLDIEDNIEEKIENKIIDMVEESKKKLEVNLFDDKKSYLDFDIKKKSNNFINDRYNKNGLNNNKNGSINNKNYIDEQKYKILDKEICNNLTNDDLACILFVRFKNNRNSLYLNMLNIHKELINFGDNNNRENKYYNKNSYEKNINNFRVKNY